MARLARRLAHADHVQRQLAVRALGDSGDPRAVRPLCRALEDEAMSVAMEAAQALARIPDPRAVPALIAAVERDGVGDRRLAAVRALAAIGRPEAIDALLASLAFARDRNLGLAVEAIAGIGSAAEEALIVALTDPRWHFRYGAALTLGRMGCPEAVPHLIRSLDDPDLRVRHAAALALAEVGDATAIAPLRRALGKTRRMASLRAYAAALDALGARPGPGRERERQLMWVAGGRWDRLAAAGPAAVPTLIAAVRDEEAEVRKGALRTLGTIGDPRASKQLIRALADRHLGNRVAAADALGQIGRRDAVAPLGKLLCRKAESWSKPQEAAAEALGAIGGAEAIRLLRRVLESPGRTEVRQAAARALGRIGSAPALAALDRALNADDLAIRATAAAALRGHRGLPVRRAERIRHLIAAADLKGLERMGAAAVPGLLTALADQPEARQWDLVRTLFRIGDHRAAPSLVEWLIARPLLFSVPKSLEAFERECGTLFGDYRPLLLRAACFVHKTCEEHECDYSDKGERTYHYGLAVSGRALSRLARLDGPAVSFLLARLAEKPDAEVVLSESWNEWGGGASRGPLSFARQRALARAALERRGRTAVPAAVLKRETTWKI